MSCFKVYIIRIGEFRPGLEEFSVASVCFSNFITRNTRSFFMPRKNQSCRPEALRQRRQVIHLELELLCCCSNLSHGTSQLRNSRCAVCIFLFVCLLVLCMCVTPFRLSLWTAWSTLLSAQLGFSSVVYPFVYMSTFSRNMLTSLLTLPSSFISFHIFAADT